MLILMLDKYLRCLLLIFLLTSSEVGFAQESQGPKSRDVLVKESIANLDSTDIHVAAQAARDLGSFRATEAVPALLRVLRSSRFLWISEHNMPKDKSGVSEWVVTDVKAEIITSLGLIGDKRAVPVLKKYLKKPPKGSAVFTRNVAWALYQITGKAYKYKDGDGKIKVYQKLISINAPSNNGMHPTANSAAFIGQLGCLLCCVRGG